MTDFMELYKQKVNTAKTFTDNGAVAYATSGKALTDFNFQVTALRHQNEKIIAQEMLSALFEDPSLFITYLFFLRDIREGMGERKIFRVVLKHLTMIYPDLMIQYIPYIGEFGRYDDLLVLLDLKASQKAVLTYFDKTLRSDLIHMEENKPVTLLAKWLPSINTSSQKQVQYARMIAKFMGMNEQEYRQTLSRLRKYLDVVEVKMCANNWQKINYENLTSFNQLKYNDSFMKHDAQRRKAYLDSLAEGKAKINASVLSPVDIVRKYSKDSYFSYYVKEKNEELELLWKNLKNMQLSNTLVVRDGSGSMIGTPLTVATALAVYCSERNTGYFKDQFITFSSRPEYVDLSKCNSLYEKLKYCYTFDDYTITDLARTMILILSTAIDHHLSQEDMPERILIISDMQFDGYGFNLNQSLMDKIKEQFELYGYKLPKMIFWNVNENLSNTIPMQENELGLCLVSSYSADILKMVMSDHLDPYEILKERIMSDRYQTIREIAEHYFNKGTD